MIKIHNEHIVKPFNNGITLVKPKRQCSGQDNNVSDLLNLPCSTYFETADGVICALNERNAEFCGYDSIGQAIGKHYFDHLPEQSVEILRKHDYKTMSDGTNILDEYINKDDGSTLHTVSIKSPWYNDAGKIVGLFGISIIAGKDCFSDPFRELASLGLLKDFRTKPLLKPKLTTREAQCAKLLSQGMTAKEIAAAVNLSSRTIEYYIDNIKTKLNCRNKIELAAVLAKHFN